MKKKIPIKTFWYSDILILPKVVTIITTLDNKGIVNAAPISLFTPYDVMTRQPQVLLGMRKFGHTYKNIVATGEFVVNFPSAEFLDDIMETSRFYPEGVNELTNTRFTEVPSQEVSPPSLKECGQHIECRLHKNYEIDRTQAKVIGDIAAIVVNEDIVSHDRGERIKQLDLPVYMGDEKRKYFYFSRAGSADMLEHKPPPKQSEQKFKTKIPWDQKALQAVGEIPSFVQSMVVEMTEDIVKKEGAERMTYDRFMELMKEYAPDEVMERFENS